VTVVPQGCCQAVTQVRAVFQAGMGRVVHGFENLQLVQRGHVHYLWRLSYSAAQRLTVAGEAKAQESASAFATFSRRLAA
jgi:tRNA(Arg) A34 adenosine deaminase TadA